jgi:oligopeptidase A
MENWAWEKPALDVFARHHATRAPIPDALFAKLSRARKYRAANALVRQLGFAALDLALHADASPPADPVKTAREVFQRFSPTELPDDYAMIASFSHLFAYPVGYAAGYYSYTWADVLDADAFTRFKREGLFSDTVGAAFRDEILAKGNSEEPMDLYRRFMGREPKIDALLERTGVA